MYDIVEFYKLQRANNTPFGAPIVDPAIQTQPVQPTVTQSGIDTNQPNQYFGKSYFDLPVGERQAKYDAWMATQADKYLTQPEKQAFITAAKSQKDNPFKLANSDWGYFDGSKDSSGILGGAKDLALAGAKGALSLVEAAVSVAPEAFKYNPITQTQYAVLNSKAGNDLQKSSLQTLKSWQDSLENLKTYASKKEEAESIKVSKAADDKAEARLDANPNDLIAKYGMTDDQLAALGQRLYTQPGETLVEVLGTGGIMKLGSTAVLKLLETGAKAFGKKLSEKQVSHLATATNLLVGGATGVGFGRNEIAQRIEEDGKARGLNEEQIAKLIENATEYKLDNAGKLTTAAIIGGLDAQFGILSRAIGTKPIKNKAVDLVVDAALEGVQGGSEKYIGGLSSVQSGIIEENKAGLGVGSAALFEAIGGAASSGAMSGASSLYKGSTDKLDPDVKKRIEVESKKQTPPSKQTFEESILSAQEDDIDGIVAEAKKSNLFQPAEINALVRKRDEKLTGFTSDVNLEDDIASLKLTGEIKLDAEKKSAIKTEIISGQDLLNEQEKRSLLRDETNKRRDELINKLKKDLESETNPNTINLIREKIIRLEASKDTFLESFIDADATYTRTKSIGSTTPVKPSLETLAEYKPNDTQAEANIRLKQAVDAGYSIEDVAKAHADSYKAVQNPNADMAKFTQGTIESLQGTNAVRPTPQETQTLTDASGNQAFTQEESELLAGSRRGLSEPVWDAAVTPLRKKYEALTGKVINKNNTEITNARPTPNPANPIVNSTVVPAIPANAGVPTANVLPSTGRTAVMGDGGNDAQQQNQAQKDFKENNLKAEILLPNGAMKAHRDYAAAKTGDTEAAQRMLTDLLPFEQTKKLADSLIGKKLLPVANVKQENGNAIPYSLAVILNQRHGTEVAYDVFRKTPDSRTEMDGKERLLSKPEFDAVTESAGEYVILDDTVTMGGTILALQKAIEANGGKVSGAIAITGQDRSSDIGLTKETYDAVKQKFGDIESDFTNASGRSYAEITESEGRYILRGDGFRQLVAEKNNDNKNVQGAGVRRQDAEVNQAPKQAQSTNLSENTAKTVASEPAQKPAKPKPQAVLDKLAGKAETAKEQSLIKELEDLIAPFTGLRLSQIKNQGGDTALLKSAIDDAKENIADLKGDSTIYQWQLDIVKEQIDGLKEIIAKEVPTNYKSPKNPNKPLFSKNSGNINPQQKDAVVKNDTYQYGQKENSATVAKLSELVASALREQQPDGGAFKPISFDKQKELDIIAEAFGKKIVGFKLAPVLRGKKSEFSKIGGVTAWKQFPNTIFINQDGDRPHFATLGHELAHHLARDDKATYDELVNELRPYVKLSEYQSKFLKSAVARDLTDANAIREEFVGEILSDAFLDPVFWNALGEKSPSLLSRVVGAVGELIDNAKRVFGKIRRAEQYVTDFDKVMQIAGKAMAKYADKQATTTFQSNSQSEQNTNNTPAAITTALDNRMGKGAVARMPSLSIVKSVSDVPKGMLPSESNGKDGVPQAYYNSKTGAIVLIADRIAKGEEFAVFLHEVGHKRLQQAIGTVGMKRLTDAVTAWKNAPEGSKERAVYEAAHKRATDSGDYKNEFLTYAIEEAEKLGLSPDLKAPQGTVEKWLALVKDMFSKALTKLMAGQKVPDLTVSDLTAIARGAAGLELTNAPIENAQNETNNSFEDVSIALENISRDELNDDDVFSKTLPEIDDENINLVADVSSSLRGLDKMFVYVKGESIREFGPHEFYFYDKNDEPIGFARLTKNQDTASINMIGIKEEHRGNGYAKAFYKYLLDNENLNIKSDTEITDATVAVYKSLYENYKMEVLEDGRVLIKTNAPIENNQSEKPFDGIEKARTPLGDTKTVTVDGKEYSVFNSDGKPIHGTVEGVRNFVRWFGDSQVTDSGKTMSEGGKPLIVYHGTESDFTEFKKSLIGTRTNGNTIGFYFTTNKKIASGYADAGIDALSPNVMPVYLKSIKTGIVDAEGAGFNKMRRVYENAPSLGKDGVIVKNVQDFAKNEDFADVKSIDVYAVFEPNQIKSATGNNGDFNPANNDIRYSLSSNNPNGGVLSSRATGADLNDATVDAINQGDIAKALDIIADTSVEPNIKKSVKLIKDYISGLDITITPSIQTGVVGTLQKDGRIDISLHESSKENLLNELAKVALDNSLNARKDTQTDREKLTHRALEAAYEKVMQSDNIKDNYGKMSLNEYVNKFTTDAEFRSQIDQDAARVTINALRNFVGLSGIKNINNSIGRTGSWITSPASIAPTKSTALVLDKSPQRSQKKDPNLFSRIVKTLADKFIHGKMQIEDEGYNNANLKDVSSEIIERFTLRDGKAGFHFAELKDSVIDKMEKSIKDAAKRLGIDANELKDSLSQYSIAKRAQFLTDKETQAKQDAVEFQQTMLDNSALVQSILKESLDDINKAYTSLTSQLDRAIKSGSQPSKTTTFARIDDIATIVDNIEAMMQRSVGKGAMTESMRQVVKGYKARLDEIRTAKTVINVAEGAKSFLNDMIDIAQSGKKTTLLNLQDAKTDLKEWEDAHREDYIEENRGVDGVSLVTANGKPLPNGMRRVEAQRWLNDIDALSYADTVKEMHKEVLDSFQAINEYGVQEGVLDADAVARLKTQDPFYVPFTGDSNKTEDETVFVGGNRKFIEKMEGSHTYSNSSDIFTNLNVTSQKMAKFVANQTLGDVIHKAHGLGSKLFKRDQLNPQIKYIVDGKTYGYSGNTDEITSMLSPSVDKSNAFGRTLRAATTTYGQTLTRAVPIFAPINAFKDAGTRMFNLRGRNDLQDKDGKQLSVNTMRARYTKNFLSPTVIKEAVMAGLFNKETGNLRALREQGGLSTWTESIRTENDVIKLFTNSKLDFPKKVISVLQDIVNRYNNMFEHIVVGSAYKSMVDAGMASERAAFITKDMMNFEQKGTGTDVARTMFVFFNPAAQDAFQYKKTFYDRRKGVNYVAIAELAGVTAIAAILYGALSGADDEDKFGNKYMDLLSEAEMSNKIPIPLGGGKYFYIPMPFGAMQTAWISGVAIARYQKGIANATDTNLAIAHSLVKSFQLTGEPQVKGVADPILFSTYSLTPTITKPLLYAMLNMRFNGTKLNYFLSGEKNKSDQGNFSTPDAYKTAAKNLRELTGSIDYTPEQIQVIAEGYMTGPFNLILGAMVGDKKEEMASKGKASEQSFGAIERAIGINRLFSDKSESRFSQIQFYNKFNEDYINVIKKYGDVNKSKPRETLDEKLGRFSENGATPEELSIVRAGMEYKKSRAQAQRDEKFNELKNRRNQGEDVSAELETYFQKERDLQDEFLEKIKP